MRYFSKHKWVIPVGIAAIVLIVLYAFFGGFSAGSFLSDSGGYHSSINSAFVSIQIPHNSLVDVRQSTREYLQQSSEISIISESSTVNERTAYVRFEFTVPVEQSDRVLEELYQFGKLTSFSQQTRTPSTYQQQQGIAGDPTIVTVRLTLTERSGIFSAFTGLEVSKLARMFFSSMNVLIWFISAILPWALFGGAIWVGIHFLGARKRPPRQETSSDSQGKTL